MKLSSSLNFAQSDFKKMWRYNFSPFGTDGQIYFNINTFEPWTSRKFNFGSAVFGWYTLGDATWLPADDEWHCYEFRLKLNSAAAVADGIATVWLDGVQKGTNTAINFDGVSGSVFTTTNLGTGNSGTITWQSSWQAFEFDDYVLSTEYIGPVGLPETYRTVKKVWS
jgi:hypothetical protein